MLMARAQGMNIVSALVANKDNRILDWQYFRKGGGEHPASNLPSDRCWFSVRRIGRRSGATPSISACAITRSRRS